MGKMDKLDQYRIKATDWRLSLQRNRSNTFKIILLFFIIYAVVGFLFDVFLYETYHQPYYWLNSAQEIAASQHQYIQYQNTNPANDTVLSIKEIMLNLLTFKIFPTATSIMIVVACLSLWITFVFHRRLALLGTDYYEVTSDNAKTLAEKQLYNVLEEMKIASGIAFMPKLYIIEADYMNAFASGYSEKNSLIAITRGLLEKLDRDELEAVIAHELSHIRHNDIRVILTAVILSNLILVAFDILFRGVLYSRRRDSGSDILILVLLIVRFVLPILTLLLMMYLSRTREFMADAGSVELMRSNEPLGRALLKIDSDYADNQENYQNVYKKTAHEDLRQVSYLYNPKDAGIRFMSSLNTLFSTHPPIAERLKALGIEKK